MKAWASRVGAGGAAGSRWGLLSDVVYLHHTIFVRVDEGGRDMQAGKPSPDASPALTKAFSVERPLVICTLERVAVSSTHTTVFVR